MTSSDRPMRSTAHDGHVSRGLWVGLVVGAPLIAHGARGAVQDLPGVQLTSFLRWFVGAALVHDLLVAPLVVGVAWVVSSRLPAIVLGPVQAAMVASGVVGVVSWPFVRGYGSTPGEDSFLSRNYTASVVAIWTVIWLTALVAVAIRAARGSGLRRPP